MKATQIENGKWSSFLWRGTTFQHLYTINSYRNLLEHIEEQPFRAINGPGWNIPDDVMDKCEKGERLGQMIELIMTELLEWYLPWHEQVYLPWVKSFQ